MTDDEIKQMQEEIDEEKSMGLGLPVEVTNQVSAQQMMGDIQGEQQAAMAQHQAGIDQQQENISPGTFVKIKQIL
jgi:hypothetical protein